MNDVGGCTCSNCGSERPGEAGPCPACGDTRRTFAVGLQATAEVVAECEVAVKRGKESWEYFRFIAGLAVAIAIGIVALLDIPVWAKIICTIAVVAAVLVVLADDAKVHNWLLALRRAYEDRWR